MCGIFAIVSQKAKIKEAIKSLKKMEYRGYDSAGIAFAKEDKVNIIKEKGEISNLEKSIKKNLKVESEYQSIIAHTRWATHGKANRTNSHPHYDENFVLVHNGIIENYQQLKERLLTQSEVVFKSETDSEIIPYLISWHLKKTENYKQAIFATIAELEGSFAIAIINKNKPNLITVAKKGSPLAIGYGKGEHFIASDYLAFCNLTNKSSVFEDGDVAFITKDEVQIFNQEQQVERKIEISTDKEKEATKGKYKYFMLKEIFEQPQAIKNTIKNYLSTKDEIKINLNQDLRKISYINIIACGTSHHAAMIAKYAIEQLSSVNVEVDIASEFRYRTKNLKNHLNIFISQSGETADTLAALQKAKENNCFNIAIVNKNHSAMENLANYTLKTIAGPEIGVASTKAYVSQLTVLLLLALKFSEERKEISTENLSKNIKILKSIPKKTEQFLANSHQVQKIKYLAKKLKKSSNIIYVGRLISYITALEGALKLKELSYINSFGIAAGELKHGTIAVIDKNSFTIAISTSYNHEIHNKTAANIEEIQARSGKIILITDDEIDISHVDNKNIINFPKAENFIAEAILPIIPAQLIAYYVALAKGNNVDKPRNLAKSVTVE
jgi:glucosamine--fructose-6-phosphate aminotransferase (isomerizing)